jgi:enolase
MVVVKSVVGKSISDSRSEKTIFVSVSTNVGKFSASAPNGKSIGKYEAPSYRRDLEKAVETLRKFSDYFSDEIIDDFGDLRRIEDVVEGHIGANTLFALESAILKALAKEKKKEVWQLINPHAKKFPRLVGNCIGGGKHSTGKRPDFQEFLLIPKTSSVKEAFEILKDGKKEAFFLLRKKDEKFEGRKNDEDAWCVGLNEKEVFDTLSALKIPLGVDVAASSFYKRKRYHYQNPMLERSEEEQLSYVSNLIKNFGLFYIEDPFGEDDFLNFAKLHKKFPDSLIVGDD